MMGGLLMLLKIMTVLSAFLVAISSFCITSVTSFAGAVATPIGGELVGQLLVALGLMSQSDDGLFNWDWRTDTAAGQSIYTTDIFGNVVPKISSGEPCTSEELSPLLGTVIPNDLYTFTANSDGTNSFQIGGKPLSTSDLFVTAKSLGETNYKVPVNIKGASFCSVTTDDEGSRYFYSFFSQSYVPNKSGLYAFYVDASGKQYMSNDYFCFTGEYDTQGRALISSGLWTQRPNLSVISSSIPLSSPRYLAFPYLGINGAVGCFMAFDDIGRPWDYRFPNPYCGNIYNITDDTFVSYNDAYRSFTSCTFVDCDGAPVSKFDVDSNKLDGAVVQIKKDNEDNNGGTPPSPVSPNSYPVWQSIVDLLREIDTGEITNGGTDFGEYVNNNYNYVDVDINVPDTQNINVGGGLDITGSGDINVTIHEDVSLPSAGDGTNFFGADAVDAIAALTSDNPIIGLLSGFFRALDPALVGIVSVSISLLVVLGIWRLIRG